MNRHARGQSLVLAALTGLLLVLIVLGTLSIGIRIKKKVELQVMSDTAAHSRAALVARGFNLIARANRSQAGEMVAAAGVQALISWTSLHIELLKEAQQGMQVNSRFSPDCRPCSLAPGAMNPPFCGCDCATARADAAAAAYKLGLERTRVQAGYDPLEAAAWNDEEGYRTSALELYKLESDALADLMSDVTQQRVTRDFMRKGTLADNSVSQEWRAPLFQSRVGDREVNTAIEAPALDNTDALKLVLGSRGAAFTTRRDGASGATQARINAILGNGRAQVDAALAGATYFSNRRQHGDPTQVDDFGLWSEDHGDITARVTVLPLSRPPGLGACPDFINVRRTSTADVVTTMSAQADQHRIDGVPRVEPAGRHIVAPCDCAVVTGTAGSATWNPTTCSNPPACVANEWFTSLSHPARMAQALSLGQTACTPCPGVFPLFIRTSDPVPEVDIFKQPKTYAVLTRRPDRGALEPWNLTLRFGFSGPPQLYTTTGDLDGTAVIDDPGLETLQAISAGVTYYHYYGPGGWTEEPNLFNPFWRGTLAMPDVDDQGRLFDYPDTLNRLGGGPTGAARQIHDALMLGGWKGGQ
jgi:hypothetical protein